MSILKKIALLTLLTLFSFISLLYQVCVVMGSSMENTFFPGQPVIINKRDKSCDINDIVVFNYKGNIYIKRIFATENQNIYLQKASCYKDYTAVYTENEYNSKKSIWHKLNKKGYAIKTTFVKKHISANHIFVLGDFLEASIDSRDFGAIPKECVIGTILGKHTQPIPYRHKMQYMPNKKDEHIY